jgi:hypothetical protein
VNYAAHSSTLLFHADVYGNSMTNLLAGKNRSSIWPWERRLVTIVVIVLFALAYSQAPLFTSNQNQYFLHGAADAGVGTLESDWLANTVDPTPVFTALVGLTFILKLPALFHVYYTLLLGVYLYSLWGLLLEALQPGWNRLQRWIVLLVLISAHSFAMRFGLSRVFGQEWRYILEGGFAGQRLLGTVFQPSTFGVFILLGILLFIRDMPVLAVFSVVAAATVHPTYLLSAGLVIASFMLVSAIEDRSLRRAFFIGILALALVGPILCYVQARFRPTSPLLSELASRILVEERIPGHILLEEWINPTVLFQSIFILTAIWIFRKRPIAKIMMVITTGVVLLTFLQIETDNQRLALLFPWRPSALLVPLASSLLLGFMADKLFHSSSLGHGQHRRLILGITWGTLFVLAALGVASYLHDLRNKKLDTARPMFEFIRSNHLEGDRYFIPPKQQDFRLATGAPVMVDFKSIPYVDEEVIEWFERLRVAQNFYREQVGEWSCGLIDKAVALGGINHVVLGPDQLDLECSRFSELIFSDGSYRVYRLDLTD